MATSFTPNYLALNPNAVVPTLVHRGRAVIESNIILEYLEDAFPTPPLRPADPHSRAGARQWMAKLDGDGGIHHAASVATYAIAYRHHLIARAGTMDRGPLLAAINSCMNPKSPLLAAGRGLPRHRVRRLSQGALPVRQVVRRS